MPKGGRRTRGVLAIHIHEPIENDWLDLEEKTGIVVAKDARVRLTDAARRYQYQQGLAERSPLTTDLDRFQHRLDKALSDLIKASKRVAALSHEHRLAETTGDERADFGFAERLANFGTQASVLLHGLRKPVTWGWAAHEFLGELASHNNDCIPPKTNLAEINYANEKGGRIEVAALIDFLSAIQSLVIPLGFNPSENSPAFIDLVRLLIGPAPNKVTLKRRVRTWRKRVQIE